MRFFWGTVGFSGSGTSPAATRSEQAARSSYRWRTSSWTTRHGQYGTWWSTPESGGSASVLVSPQWSTSVSWEERAVHLALTRAAIQRSPQWLPSEGVNRRYEARLCDYYGRPVYWAQPMYDDAKRETHTAAS